VRTDERTDGRKDGRKKASHDISPVHSVHLADIKIRNVQQVAMIVMKSRDASSTERRDWTRSRMEETLTSY